MSIWKRIISYLLPITAVLIIPSVILVLAWERTVFRPFFIIIGILLFALGLLLLFITVRMLEKEGKGTLAPWSPPKELIVSGPYKYVRNPMISGVLFAQFGIGFIFLNYWLFVWAVSFLVLNIIYFKLSEEPGLIKRFGVLYEKYRKEVPMWFPVRIFRRRGGKDEGEE